MGHRLSKDGLSLDPTKTKGILEIPRPENKKAVEQFLGCLQYLAHFLPQLAKYSQSPCLKFYNVTEKATIQCDAFEKGLGAAKWSASCFCITFSEQNYAQIEK